MYLVKYVYIRVTSKIFLKIVKKILRKKNLNEKHKKHLLLIV